MKKKIILLIALLCMFISKANADTCTLEDTNGFCLNMDLHEQIKGTDYFGNNSPQQPDTTYYKITTNNEMVYCSNVLLFTHNLKETGIEPIDKKCQPITTEKNSLIYIYEYGYGENKINGQYNYNSKYLTGNDRYEDYYITQTAVWAILPPTEQWLIEQREWDKNWFNVGYDFTAGTYFGNKYDTVTLASNLTNDALAAIDAKPVLDIAAKDKAMVITSDGKYYSSEITVTGKYLTTETKLTVTGLTGAIITDGEGKELVNGIISNGTEPSFEKNVYIKVPVANMKENTVSIKIKADSKSTFNSKSTIIECDPNINDYVNITEQSMIKYNPNEEVLTDEETLTVSRYTVKISKKDDKDVYLPGATLVVKQNNIVVKTFTSTSDIVTLSLPAGIYTLEETKAPDGYKLNKAKITFTIDNSGKVYIGSKETEEVTLTNKPIVITISKRAVKDENELPGATLRITDKDGNVAKDMDGNELEWVTTGEAKTFTVSAGTYILEETKAPDGYELSDKRIEFTVTPEGTVTIETGLLIKKAEIVMDNNIVFENTPEPKQVPTGSIMAIVATLLCISSLGVSLYIITKKTQNQN